MQGRRTSAIVFKMSQEKESIVQSGNYGPCGPGSEIQQLTVSLFFFPSGLFFAFAPLRCQYAYIQTCIITGTVGNVVPQV